MLASSPRHFPRTFVDNVALTAPEIVEVRTALTAATTRVARLDHLSKGGIEGGGLYVGLGGVAAAHLLLHESGVNLSAISPASSSAPSSSQQGFLATAAALVHRAMQPDLMPSAKVRTVRLHSVHTYRN